MQISKENKLTPAKHKKSTRQAALLEIKRDFKAPVENLFKAFSTSKAIKAWWWPKDLYSDQVDFEFREGGHYFINMKGSKQAGGGMTGEFEEIIENQRIVMTDSFANKDGKAISAAEANMPGEWPENAYITLEFTALDQNRSRLHLSQEGIPNELQDDCIQGWNQSFDKLDSYLSEKQ